MELEHCKYLFEWFCMDKCRLEIDTCMEEIYVIQSEFISDIRDE